jgi:branched-chain amino acid transport system permease protein
MGTRLGFGFPASIISAWIAAGAIGFLISLLSLRFHEDYFILATFAFQLICVGLFNNWVWMTGGPLGIKDIPNVTVFGHSFHSVWQFVLLGAFFLLMTCAIVARIVKSPFGLVLWAIRHDEILAASFGKPVLFRKVQVFALSSILASTSGALFAYYVGFVDPTSFTLQESIFIITMAVVGGSGNRRWWGPIVGVLVLVGLTESFRMVGMMGTETAKLRQLVYGLMLMGFLMFRPRGLVVTGN